MSACVGRAVNLRPLLRWQLDNLHLHKSQHRLASSSHFPIAAPEGQRRGIRQCPAGYWQISGNKKAGYLAAPTWTRDSTGLKD